ncbi:hypothetical protein KDL45_11275, partial [bacterium]|nr:hypothetical protein [bacterium]
MRRSPGAERRLWFLLFVLSALLMLAIAGAACGDDDDDDDSSSSIDDDTGDDDITDDDDDDDTDDDDTSDDDTADDDTGDDDTAEAPFFPVGGPFADADENAGEWVWLPVPGNICRDGSATGIAVRLQENANKLMIFMQGGGACFDAGTCAGNPKKFGEAEFNSATTGELTRA